MKAHSSDDISGFSEALLVDVKTADPTFIKSCCANLYESEWARLLLGDSFHPGGVALTERLGQLTKLTPQDKVLDVASGQGTSALFLAEKFGCEVIGVDYGATAVADANKAAKEAGLADRVTFRQGDAERLPFDNGTFDVVICECAFCTFPSKATAAAEFKRVLKPSGRLGLSDLTRVGPVPNELANLLSWIACLADAQPIERYISYLENVGINVAQVETHNKALHELVRSVRGKLLGAELLIKLKKVDLPLADVEQANGLARHAEKHVRAGKFGYSLLLGEKS